MKRRFDFSEFLRSLLAVASDFFGALLPVVAILVGLTVSVWLLIELIWGWE